MMKLPYDKRNIQYLSSSSLAYISPLLDVDLPQYLPQLAVLRVTHSATSCRPHEVVSLSGRRAPHTSGPLRGLHSKIFLPHLTTL